MPLVEQTYEKRDKAFAHRTMVRSQDDFHSFMTYIKVLDSMDSFFLRPLSSKQVSKCYAGIKY